MLINKSMCIKINSNPYTNDVKTIEFRVSITVSIHEQRLTSSFEESLQLSVVLVTGRGSGGNEFSIFAVGNEFRIFFRKSIKSELVFVNSK